VDSNFIEKLNNYLVLDRFDPYDQAQFNSSPAGSAHGFKLIGNGYFYSAYEAGFLEKAFNFLNFGLGDLFSQCNAGDIRVRFSAIMPYDVSVIGEQVN